ncbi:MAG: hypothetical protein ACYC5Q_16210 [Thermoleophilia bacterium]
MRCDRDGVDFALGREGDNQDPRYLRDLLLYRLTLEADRAVEESPLSKREFIRRLRTSPAQVLDRDVDLVVRAKSSDAR